jgi:hypothetical protein
MQRMAAERATHARLPDEQDMVEVEMQRMAAERWAQARLPIEQAVVGRECSGCGGAFAVNMSACAVPITRACWLASRSAADGGGSSGRRDPS